MWTQKYRFLWATSLKTSKTPDRSALRSETNPKPLQLNMILRPLKYHVAWQRLWPRNGIKLLAHEGSWCRNLSQRPVAATKSCVVHTRLRMSHPCDILSLLHVPWSATSWTLSNMLRGQNCPQIACYTKLKLSGHTRGHVAATCPNVTLSLLRVPATRPRYISPICEQHMILWRQQYMSPRHVPGSRPLACGKLYRGLSPLNLEREHLCFS